MVESWPCWKDMTSHFCSRKPLQFTIDLHEIWSSPAWATKKKKTSYFPLYWLFTRDTYIVIMIIPEKYPIKTGASKFLLYTIYTYPNPTKPFLHCSTIGSQWNDPPAVLSATIFGFPQRRSHALVGLPNASGENVGRSPAGWGAVPGLGSIYALRVFVGTKLWPLSKNKQKNMWKNGILLMVQKSG